LQLDQVAAAVAVRLPHLQTEVTEATEDSPQVAVAVEGQLKLEPLVQVEQAAREWQ
jgi:hypothetical protein